jgi:hypothetical protein
MPAVLFPDRLAALRRPAPIGSRATAVLQAIGYYDRILHSANDPRPCTGRRWLSRSQAARVDGGLPGADADPGGALYLAFKGDYYATAGQSAEAADAYRAAVTGP